MVAITTAYAAYTDLELVDLLKQGNKAAYAEIYGRFRGILYVHAFKRLKDTADAEDAVHDLFAQLWLNRENLNLTTGNLAGYLYVTIRNNVLTTISRRGYAEKYFKGHWKDLTIENSVTDYRARENQLKEIIERNVALLPRKMRDVFELSRNQQLSHKEIADQLSISEHTVKSQINSALNILRSKLSAVVFIWMLMNH